MPRIRWTLEENERLLGLIAAGKSWTFISAALRRGVRIADLKARDAGPAQGEGEMTHADVTHSFYHLLFSKCVRSEFVAQGRQ
jgi:hypothetical protein